MDLPIIENIFLTLLKTFCRTCTTFEITVFIPSPAFCTPPRRLRILKAIISLISANTLLSPSPPPSKVLIECRIPMTRMIERIGSQNFFTRPRRFLITVNTVFAVS